MFEKDRERNSEREDEGGGRPSLIFHKDNQASLCSCVFALGAHHSRVALTLEKAEESEPLY